MIARRALPLAALAVFVAGAGPRAGAPAGAAFVTAVDRPIRSLFPPTTADASGEPAAALLFESLLERHWSDDRFVASLAKKWEVSKDKLTYRFWLDPAARFWDGSPVTPEDVQFSHQVHELEGVDAEPWYTHYLFVKRVQPKGKDQVDFTVASASWASFAAVATMKIYQKKHYMRLYEADKTLRKGPSQRAPMGTGPWTLEALTEQELRLVRNPAYWARKRHEREGRWTHPRRTLRFLETPEARLAALERGELSYLNLTKEQWIAAHEPGPPPKGLTFVKAENLVPQPYDFIGWNHKHPALFAMPVRWAMSCLVDLKDWTQRLDRGLTRPTLGPLGPKPPFADPALAAPRLDLAEAARRRASAGWREKDAEGWLVKDGRRLEVEIVYPALGPGQYGPKIFQMAEAGRKVGVRIDPKSASWGEIEQRIASGNFGGIVMSWTRTPDASIRRMLHKDYVKEGDNFVNFRSDRASALIDELDRAFDPKQRQRLGRELQRLIHTLQPYTFLTEYRYVLYARDARIVAPQPTLPFQIGVAFWRL